MRRGASAWRYARCSGFRTFVVMPGGFSPVYARMAQEIGFTCFFLTE